MDNDTDALTRELEAVRLRRSLPSPSQLRARRERAGLSQSAVARLLGATPSSVCRWEAGTRRPGGRLLADYIALLDRLSEAA
jgi:DNA-binding transcriptional regulator YiaG